MQIVLIAESMRLQVIDILVLKLLTSSNTVKSFKGDADDVRNSNSDTA